MAAIATQVTNQNASGNASQPETSALTFKAKGSLPDGAAQPNLNVRKSLDTTSTPVK